MLRLTKNFSLQQKKIFIKKSSSSEFFLWKMSRKHFYFHLYLSLILISMISFSFLAQTFEVSVNVFHRNGQTFKKKNIQAITNFLCLPQQRKKVSLEWISFLMFLRRWMPFTFFHSLSFFLFLFLYLSFCLPLILTVFWLFASEGQVSEWAFV